MADDAFETWLEKTAKCSGVLAASVRHTNQVTFVKSYHESFPEARVQEVMQKLTETAFNLRQSQLGGSRLQWTFEHGRVHTARRGDGVIAMLAVNNDPKMTGAIEELLTEFLTLERGDEGQPQGGV